MTTALQNVARDEKSEFLRHTLATLAYRGGKALRGAPAEFALFGAPDTSRTPVKIVAHMGDLLDWALSLAKGKEAWHESEPLPWNDEVRRFFAAMQTFEDYLVSGQPLGASVEELFQGPIADALTHTGQLTMLRRMAGAPVKGENYRRAEIVAGRVGREQATPRREF